MTTIICTPNTNIHLWRSCPLRAKKISLSSPRSSQIPCDRYGIGRLNFLFEYPTTGRPIPNRRFAPARAAGGGMPLVMGSGSTFFAGSRETDVEGEV